MKEKEEAAVKALVAESGCEHSPELVEELIQTALRLGRDKAPVADLKLFVRSLKELRYASKVFQPYSDRRKVAVFGSARLAPETAEASRHVLGDRGWSHVGPSGSGHFVKMVHNGIEYGIMASYAEGLNILKHADVGDREQEVDAETTPLRNPEHYRYHLDLPEIAEVWRRGTVIRSWLLDLTAAALFKDPELSGFAGRVSDSGEGRWTALAAIETGTPASVLTEALYERFTSRGEAEFANRILSAQRNEFGGHDEKPAEGS